MWYMFSTGIRWVPFSEDLDITRVLFDELTNQHPCRVKSIEGIWVSGKFRQKTKDCLAANNGTPYDRLNHQVRYLSQTAI